MGANRFTSGTQTFRVQIDFQKKMKVDVSIDKYKARLVIKGYRQREGVNFFDTYYLITRITSIRMLLAFEAINS